MNQVGLIKLIGNYLRLKWSKNFEIWHVYPNMVITGRKKTCEKMIV